MNYDEAAEKIALSHELIQTKPLDRLDFINKTAEVKQVIMSCIIYMDQLYASGVSWEFSEEEFSKIHESVCVAAIPLLDMVEHFMKKAEAETREHHLAV